MSNIAVNNKNIPRSYDIVPVAIFAALIILAAGLAVYAIQDNIIRSAVVAVSSALLAMVFFGIYETGSNYFVLKSGDVYYVESREGYRWANPSYERLTYPCSAIRVAEFEPNYLPGKAGTTLSIACRFDYLINDILSAVLAGNSESELSKTIYRESMALLHNENPIMDKLSSENIYQYEGVLKSAYIDCLAKTLDRHGCLLSEKENIIFRIELI